MRLGPGLGVVERRLERPLMSSAVRAASPAPPAVAHREKSVGQPERPGLLRLVANTARCPCPTASSCWPVFPLIGAAGEDPSVARPATVGRAGSAVPPPSERACGCERFPGCALVARSAPQTVGSPPSATATCPTGEQPRPAAEFAAGRGELAGDCRQRSGRRPTSVANRLDGEPLQFTSQI